MISADPAWTLTPIKESIGPHSKTKIRTDFERNVFFRILRVCSANICYNIFENEVNLNAIQK